MAICKAHCLSLATAACLDTHDGMFASLNARVFAAAPEEVRLRVLARLVAAFGGQEALGEQSAGGGHVSKSRHPSPCWM